MFYYSNSFYSDLESITKYLHLQGEKALILLARILNGRQLQWQGCDRPAVHLHPTQSGEGVIQSYLPQLQHQRPRGPCFWHWWFMVAGSYSGKGVTGLLSIFTPPSLEKESYRVTSLNYSTSGHEVLVSYSSENIYTFSTLVGSFYTFYQRKFYWLIMSLILSLY